MNLKCERCGREVGSGMGRYIMTVTFTADVDYALPERAAESDIRKLLDEIERTPEHQLMDQVHQKRAFIICRPCKEELADNPLGTSHSSSGSLM